MKHASISDFVDRVHTWDPRKQGNGSSFCYIDIGSVSQTSKTIEEPPIIQAEDAPSRARQIVKQGDILISTVRPNLNAVALVPKELDGATASTGFSILRPDENGIDRNYLFHWVRTDAFVSEMMRQATGQSYPAVSDKIIKASKIPLPPLPEQRRIAGILDQADALRRLRTRALDKLNTLGQAIFHEMFGDPATNPKNWDIKTLPDLGKLDRGVSKHRPRNDPNLLDGEHPLIQTGDVARAGDYIREYSSTYSDLGLAQSRMWPKGTVCVTIAANIADTAILAFDACFPDSVVGFDSGHEATNFFIHRWFATVKDNLEKIAPAVAQKNINLAILRSLPVIAPPREVIEVYFEKEKVIRRQLNAIEDQTRSLSDLFTSLQHRAFRGEL